MTVRVGWTMEAPAGELERLNMLLSGVTPPSDQHPWLLAYWEPGDEWEPLERIVVGLVTPRKVLVAEDRFYRSLGYGSDVSKFSELEGPNPRWGGKWDAILQRYEHASWRLPPTITQRQWLLWRDPLVRGLVVPRWIVQGEQGGTPLRYSRYESELARVSRKPTKPPLPGSMPYAPGDVRVLEALRDHETSHALSEQVREEWLRIATADDGEDHLTPPERTLWQTFSDWFSTANEDRATGKVTDAVYDIDSGRFTLADYSIPRD